ncbi:hypothetical protein [Lysobacter sp. TAB13]|uniref:hypothetical protein n=1 Tax=Lysobacter sp. TAB13 TaxID=3233065 RepID=UPI003F9CD67A
MSDISDNELILFRYRDGLSMARMLEIELALACEVSLRSRYRALQLVLDAAAKEPMPSPPPDYEDRLWQRLQPRLDALPPVVRPVAQLPGAMPGPTLRHRERPRSRRWLWMAGGTAAAAMLVLAITSPLLRAPRERSLPMDGLTTAPPVAVPAPLQAPSPAARERVLDDYVATHLRKTESVLLGVLNDESSRLAAGDDGHARNLLDDNRLYAAAAARRGDKALAGFLRTLEPVLTELANQTPDGGIQLQQEGLRELVRNADLLFQVRVVEQRLQSRGNTRA